MLYGNILVDFMKGNYNNMYQNLSNNDNFHTGFYILGKENVNDYLKKIDNPFFTEELDDCPYYDASIFLHGICHIFAYALHKIFGYEIYEILSSDRKTIHWFCLSCYQKKKVYVDIRGATTDYEEFLAEFQPWIGQDSIVNHYKKMNDMDFKDDWEDIGLKFAREIIAKNFDYYCIY